MPNSVAPTLYTAGPAWAVRDWYDYYEDGKQQAARGRCKEALASLAQARRLKPSSELHVRLYGIVFIDYVPYYYEGVCQVKTGDFKAALQSFAAEEKQGVIQKDRELHADRHGRDQAVDLFSDGVTSLPGGAVQLGGILVVAGSLRGREPAAPRLPRKRRKAQARGGGSYPWRFPGRIRRREMSRLETRQG